MLFSSIDFAIFLPIVFVLYWLVLNKNLQVQNLLLLTASYVFYCWWDWRFLFLLITLSIINYFVGIRINDNGIDKRRRIWLGIALFINIGALCVFKYFNFFIDSFIDLISLIGYDLPRSTTRIILPVGISFYIFISLSYLLDVYKRTINVNRKFFEVLLCFGFFPVILAGPIQRPSSLIPQIKKKREFNYAQAVDGLRQILWGLFVKIVIADNLAGYVDDYFLNYTDYMGSTLFFGAVFYTIQIYADFSGYSDIAIGTAKLFGFELMRNFAYPYFSRDINDFWKRWHISLTTWFRDYIFLPLSFKISWRLRGEKVFYIKTDIFIYIVSSIITWFLTGLWHGANYTFIIWGMIHGVVLIVYHIQRKPRNRLLKKNGISNNNFLIIVFETTITLCIVIIAWIFFRSENIGQALNYIAGIFSSSSSAISESLQIDQLLAPTILVVGFIFVEWLGLDQQYAFARLGSKFKRPVRYAMYLAMFISILLFGGNGQQFIYFQF